MKAKKLSSGRYRTQLVVGKDADGKRIVKSFTADTAWEAEKLALDYKKKYGVGQSVSEMTVAGAISIYINSRTNAVSPITIETYQRIRDTRLQSLMGTKITELTVQDVQIAVNIDAARLSKKSLTEAVSLMQSSLAFQGIDTNFKKRITFPKAMKPKKQLPHPRDIIREIKGTKYELAFLLAMWLSLTVSEVRGLKYSDITKDGKWLTVQRTIVYHDGRDHYDDFTKAEGRTRTVSLPKELYDMIMAQPHESDDDHIVPLGYNCLYKAIRRIMAKAGYKMSFHNLRAEFATTSNALKIPDNYIQSIGGWSNPTTMYKHYIRELTSEEQKYQAQIDSYFSGLLKEEQGSDD